VQTIKRRPDAQTAPQRKCAGGGHLCESERRDLNP
jgi:hypothetical protein